MLSLENVRFSVNTEAGKKEILSGVSFTVDSPFTVITGPNGGGKSTIAKLISGIYTPDSGRIVFNGEDITGLSVTQRAKAGISYAFQTPVRFKGITVSDLLNVASGRTLSVVEACDFLSSVGLCARDYLDREVNASLSGGELKRIEIATVLARKTPFAVFDEPEAGIDLWSFASLIRVFENVREQINGNIVIISHQERILNIADRIVVISGGKVDRAGTKEEILPTLFGQDSACSVLKGKMD
ncbi:MAG: ATP-binding cassette domain-containing protein [Clostridia bacterium]|nr:ATP-binding cassette domain-containing protein [Clostridia bacterium]